MPEILVEDDIAYEIVDDDVSVVEFLTEDEEEVSEREPERPKPEIRPAPKPAAKATTPVQVEITEDEDPEEQAEEVAAPVEVVVTDDELVGLEAELDQWIESEKASAREEGARSTQASKDREIAKLAKHLESLESREVTLQRQLDEAKTEGLSDDERQMYLDAKVLENQRREIEKLIEDHDSELKVELVKALVTDYGQYGITAADLEDLDEPDDMERVCEKAELKFLRENRNKPVVAEVAKPVARAVAPKAAKPVPAGATAPTDIGATPVSLAPTRGKIAEGTGLDKAAETLRNLPYQTVRIG